MIYIFFLLLTILGLSSCKIGSTVLELAPGASIGDTNQPSDPAPILPPNPVPPPDPPPAPTPISKAWSFNILGNYTFDSTSINVSGTSLSLNSVDLVDDLDFASESFDLGSMSNVFWNTNYLEMQTLQGTAFTNLSPALGAGAPAAYVDLSDNELLLHLDDAMTTDNDGSGNTLAISSCTNCSTFASGIIGNSLVFDGDTTAVNYGNAANVNDMDVTGLSVSLWFYANSFGENERGRLLDKAFDSYDSTNGWSIFVTNNSTDGKGIQFNRDFLTTPLKVGYEELSFHEWNHLVVTYDGSTATSGVTMYIDGQKLTKPNQEQNAAGVKPSDAVYDLIIGNSATGDRGFDGMIDEVAIFSSVLSDADVTTIYNNQVPNYQSEFTSRVFDAKTATSWNVFNPTTYASYGLALLDNGADEGFQGYNIDNSSNVKLYHFDDSIGTTNILDSSGTGTNANCTNCPTFETSGNFASSAHFDEVDDVIIIPDDLTSYSDLTISMWVKPDDTIGSQGQYLFSWGTFQSTNSINLLLHEEDYAPAKYRKTIFVTLRDSLEGVKTIYAPFDGYGGKWQHIAIVKSSVAGTTLYVNGVAIGANLTNGINAINPVADIYIGGRYDLNASRFFGGGIDEMAMWNVALSTTDIKSLYEKGAISLKFQVRACDDLSCDTELFVGPDGTASSYFRQNVSSSGLLTSHDISSLNFMDRYFQYKVFFNRYKISETPKLISVDLGLDAVLSHSPGIEINTGIGYSSLTSFAATASTTGPGASLTFQIAATGSDWLYYNGSAWIAAGSSVQSNSLSEVNLNLASFPGTGDFRFKAFLNSNKTDNVTVEDITLNYTE